MCMYQKFEQLLALEENQIFINLDTISNNNFKLLSIKYPVSYKKHSIIKNFLGGNCFEAAMGCSPGNEQGISKLDINLLIHEMSKKVSNNRNGGNNPLL